MKVAMLFIFQTNEKLKGIEREYTEKGRKSSEVSTTTLSLFLTLYTNCIINTTSGILLSQLKKILHAATKYILHCIFGCFFYGLSTHLCPFSSFNLDLGLSSHSRFRRSQSCRTASSSWGRTSSVPRRTRRAGWPRFAHRQRRKNKAWKNSTPATWL